MTEQSTTLSDLVAHLTLVDVSVVEANYKIHKADAQPPFNLDHSNIGMSCNRNDDFLMYEIHSGVSARSASSEALLFTTTSTHAVVLHLDAAFDADEDLLRKLGGSYVMRIVYPYIRELTQNLTMRSGIAPLTLDLLPLPLEFVPPRDFKLEEDSRVAEN